MNTQQIEQVTRIKDDFSNNITILFNSIGVAYRSLSYMRNDWASVSATVRRIHDETNSVSTTFKEKLQNLQKINPHGLRERTFGMSKKKKQEIQTYIYDDLKLSIAHITDLRKKIKEIIDSIRGPWSDYDDGGVDDDAVTYVGDSPSYRSSPSSISTPLSSSRSSPSLISSPRSSSRSSSSSSPSSSLIFGLNNGPRSTPRSSSRSSSRSSPSFISTPRSSSRSSPRLCAGGGKKSKKRRRQSKQTKRRQHKINKQPKLKYTIRRR